ncbi:unnamed protein product [Calypogeia fissa]
MSDDDNKKGLIWRLPTIESTDWGKLGPGFGYGIGCGVGVGAGLVGGAGFGIGFPGLQFGAGFGAGCGIGIGFGYGLGKGRASDQHRRYSNLRRPSPRKSSNGEIAGEIGAIVNDIAGGIKRAFEALEREAERRRR